MRYILSLAICLSLACTKNEAPAAPEAEPAPAAEAEPAPSASGPASSTEATEEEPPLEIRASTRLISAGKEPRTALRWRFEEGAKERLEIETKLSTKMPAGESIRPAAIYGLSLEVREVAPDGTAQVAFSVDSLEVGKAAGMPESQMARMKEALDKMKGKSGTYVVSSRGIVSEARLEGTQAGDEGFERLVRQLLQKTTIPVPEEAVGPGAQWAVDRSLRDAQIRIDEVTTVALGKRKGTSVTLEASVAIRGEEQTITKGAGVPVGGSITMKEAKGQGTIKGRWDLQKLSPSSVEAKSSEVRTFLGPDPDGGEQAVDLQYDTTVTMKRK